MKYIIIFILMLFFHIIDDYYLQGILSSLKQKEWWVNQSNYNKKYQYDYIIALFLHAFSWSFLIMLPILFCFGKSWLYIVFLFLNMLIHAKVDNMKCNEFRINLIQDQIIHVFQIILTITIFSIFM